MNKRIMIVLALILVVLIGAGIAYAAFADKGQILGSKFSVGSSDLKFYLDLTGGPVPENLVDELPGPEFNNISENWSEYYPIKIFNNGTDTVSLASFADYETANDPDDLRQIIFVEPIDWTDFNNDGVIDTETELGAPQGVKTIVKWKTEGFLLADIPQGETRGYALRFFTESVSDTKQGTSAIFDFIFDAVQVTN